MVATLDKTSLLLQQLNCSFCGKQLGLFIPKEDVSIHGVIVACDEDHCIIKWQENFED